MCGSCGFNDTSLVVLRIVRKTGTENALLRGHGARIATSARATPSDTLAARTAHYGRSRITVVPSSKSVYRNNKTFTVVHTAAIIGRHALLCLFVCLVDELDESRQRRKAADTRDSHRRRRTDADADDG